MKRKVMSAALFVVLLLTGVLTVVPFVWMVLSSFKTNAGGRRKAEVSDPQAEMQ